ncbi:GIY-YIG nuclease family protein [Actinoplanes sp. NPDC026670]|uniref:GIY-YIG nuclease family protein n=1 Tax=Actinoplanes sp. NPDC026670 TaxID=3154700 RepID=UPI003408FF1C
MPTTDLAGQREQWIAAVCAGLAGQTPPDPGLFTPALGDTDLLHALLVARATAQAAAGHRSGEIVQLLSGSGILRQGAATDQVLDLATGAALRWSGAWIGEPVALLGCGLPAWHPEATYRLLLEQWSARRLASVTPARVKRELKRHWGVTDPDWITACLTRPATPLTAYPDIWATLRAEPDPRVQHDAVLALRGTTDSNRAVERWAQSLLAEVSKAQHLHTIGVDQVTIVQALRLLRRPENRPDPSQRTVRSRVTEILGDHRDRIAAAIGELSTLERHLLRERTDDELVQDRCITQLLRTWTLRRPDTVLSGPDTEHGMRGPLPWLRIRVHGAEQVEAATATLVEGTRLLGVDRDPGAPDRLELICRRPRTGAPGLRAHFVFDLTNPVHAGELLLIGRRGGVCADLVDATDGTDTRLGTVQVRACDELAHLLTEAAGKALVAHGRETDTDSGELPALVRELLRVPAATARLDPFSPHDDLLVTAPAHPDGKVELETTDPPASAVRARPAGTVKPGDGFVYVSRNPAMPGMLKIGYTLRLPEDRAGDLRGTAVPFGFDVTYRVLTSNANAVEQAVHRLLDAQRVAAGREFFRVSQQLAEDAIQFCRQRVTGIGSWDPLPAVHRLRAGARIALPLRAGQRFAVTAYPGITAAQAVEIGRWQAHADGDLLELHVTHDPAVVRGLSDGDDDATEDPVPHLNRAGSAPNGHLIGRERLAAGDRLSWIDDHHHVVFETQDACQVICRTWNPKLNAGTGLPLTLTDLSPQPDTVAYDCIQQARALPLPRSWAPRHPDPADGWAPAATRATNPPDWLPQLHRPR